MSSPSSGYLVLVRVTEVRMRRQLAFSVRFLRILAPILWQYIVLLPIMIAFQRGQRAGIVIP